MLVQRVFLVLYQLIDETFSIHLGRQLLVVLNILDNTSKLFSLFFNFHLRGIRELRHLGQVYFLVNQIILLPVLSIHHLLKLGQFGVVLSLLDLLDEMLRILLYR